MNRRSPYRRAAVSWLDATATLHAIAHLFGTEAMPAPTTFTPGEVRAYRYMAAGMVELGRGVNGRLDAALPRDSDPAPAAA